MGEIVQGIGAIAAIAAPFLPPPFNFIAFGVSIAANILGGLLFSPPKAPGVDLPSSARGRIQNIRSSTDSHVFVYWKARVAVRPWVLA